MRSSRSCCSSCWRWPAPSSSGARSPSAALNLLPVSYFQAVRLYSLVEVCIFTSLIVVAVGGFSESAERALGWTHGFGWILPCLLVAHGCPRRTFPWARPVAAGSPLGPLGCSAGLEYLARRRRRVP